MGSSDRMASTAGVKVWIELLPGVPFLKREKKQYALRGVAIAFVCLCVGAVFLTCSGKPPRQNVLFITIDVLRADHLGCYGYPRETSPAIDAFAQESILFENCISQSTSTVPSHASIFTSLNPPSHGVITNVARLSDEIPSLVKVFESNDYSTGAIVSSFVLQSDRGLTQGFETYDETLGSPELNRREYRERRADSATDTAISWLRERGEEDFFLWVHYIDPHGAYYPPEEYREMLSRTPTTTMRRRIPVCLEMPDFFMKGCRFDVSL